MRWGWWHKEGHFFIVYHILLRHGLWPVWTLELWAVCHCHCLDLFVFGRPLSNSDFEWPCQARWSGPIRTWDIYYVWLDFVFHFCLCVEIGLKIKICSCFCLTAKIILFSNNVFNFFPNFFLQLLSDFIPSFDPSTTTKSKSVFILNFLHLKHN